MKEPGFGGVGRWRPWRLLGRSCWGTGGLRGWGAGDGAVLAPLWSPSRLLHGCPLVSPVGGQRKGSGEEGRERLPPRENHRRPVPRSSHPSEWPWVPWGEVDSLVRVIGIARQDLAREACLPVFDWWTLIGHWPRAHDLTPSDTGLLLVRFKKSRFWC